ncbi:hypothetical protein EDD85DRAFT_917483 [Armillaria nabsnona]|nr:hypothetical protein EDD85DRAFT_917483 [Armillaria nabsnona]
MAITLADIVQIIKRYSLSHINITQILLFICVSISLKNDILLVQPSRHSPNVPPKHLTLSFIKFLSSACTIKHKEVELLWEVFSDVIWAEDKTLYLPSLSCTNSHCPCFSSQFKLQSAAQHQVILYTLDQGPLPIWSIHFTCNGCNTIYHHNYYVWQDMHYYYDEISLVIEISEHHFTEKRLGNELPQDWIVHPSLSHQHVYDSFVILSLWEDHLCQDMTFTIFGQPELKHQCNRCVYVYLPQAKTVSLVVIDGNCIGRPCCHVHNCQKHLCSHQDMNRICCIKDCTSTVVTGKHTCDNSAHQEVKCIHILHEGEEADIEEEEYHVDASEEAPSMPIFGRQKKHIKEFIVAPCGMIIAQETFYGAEAVSSVAEFVKCTYKDSKFLNHIVFDNNCQLPKHVQHDPIFKNVGLSVDVFHFLCKHSKSNTFCQQYCNPVAFPELHGEGGKGWWFNTSIAEQTNVWVGRYHSICWEMHADRYDFFLDQMIIMQNQATKLKLELKGFYPTFWD